jgi:hypothetical protein
VSPTSARDPVVRIGSITPAPSAEEIAAITAALAVVDAEWQRSAGRASEPERLSLWVDASRRSAQRAGLQRGPWRLSGRLARRARA